MNKREEMATTEKRKKWRVAAYKNRFFHWSARVVEMLDKLDEQDVEIKRLKIRIEEKV